uniref:Uncharacterized protein n=1 Tax=Cannabis sativa TaxID=3483 RepID=A0A803QDP0_CANSA
MARFRGGVSRGVGSVERMRGGRYRYLPEVICVITSNAVRGHARRPHNTEMLHDPHTRRSRVSPMANNQPIPWLINDQDNIPRTLPLDDCEPAMWPTPTLRQEN